MSVKRTIVIEVKGGNVQEVYLSPDLQGCEVTLLDYDNIEERHRKLPEEVVAEQMIERGKVKAIDSL